MQSLATKVKQITGLLQSARACYSVQVVVPSLGESITDGTIAAVLKAAGDSVKENETIAQIETDKVTIDIKAPSDGVILGVVVKEQETVVPGQLVASLDDAAAQVGGALAHSLPANERNCCWPGKVGVLLRAAHCAVLYSPAADGVTHGTTQPQNASVDTVQDAFKIQHRPARDSKAAVVRGFLIPVESAHFCTC
eukprot:GHRQ01031887.1.p1 GENE.GHRQ01031887.1~~GHRQ01031887.1.p1  ORF type:complete len:226 (+),score=39.42 GHRQ01031887.1:95-679(+)